MLNCSYSGKAIKIVRHFVGNWHYVTWLLSPLSLFVTTEVVKKNYHKTFAIKRSFSGASSSVNFSGHTAKTMVKHKNLTFLSISDPCDLTFKIYVYVCNT